MCRIQFFLKEYGERSSVGRAPGCDPGGRGFEPHRSPHVTIIDHQNALDSL